VLREAERTNLDALAGAEAHPWLKKRADAASPGRRVVLA